MTNVTIGDMTRSFQLRNHYSNTKSGLTRLTLELSTGQHSDLGQAFRGDFTALSEIQHGLRLNKAYASAGAEAALITTAAQAGLEAFQANLDELAPPLLSAVGAGALHQMEIVAASAPDRLSAMIHSLNQDVAGRTVFSGTATDTRPLITAEEMLALLGPLADATVDAADLTATLEAWFMDPGGGFETLAYQGSTTAPPPFHVAEGDTISNPLTALDDGLRRAMMGMAMASLIDQGRGPGSDEDRKEILQQAALSMVSGNEGVTALRANLGHAEARIEAAQQRNDTARAMFEQEHNRLVGTDPYETATKLQEAETRLESLYLLTTRLSRLSLTEFLR